MKYIILTLAFLIFNIQAAIGQELIIQGKNKCAVFGVFQIEEDTKAIIYLDYVDNDSDPNDISLIKILYLDDMLNAKDSISFEGFINDSSKLMSISTSNFKNGKIYFTQDLKNLFNDKYYITFCSYDPFSKEFVKYETFEDVKPNLIVTNTFSTTSDSSEYIYFGTAFTLSNSIGQFPSKFFLFNTISNKFIIPSQILSMSAIFVNNIAFYFLDRIYKYFIESDTISLYNNKYIHAGFGGEAFGNKIENSLYINGRMNGTLGASITKYDIDKDEVIVKYFEYYDSACIIPAVVYDDVKLLNNKLYLPFTIIDRRLCNILEVVAYDSPPNKYGLFVMDKDLNICDTLIFQADKYRLAMSKFSINDSTVVLSGPIFEKNSIYSLKSFVHFINIYTACKTNSFKPNSHHASIQIFPNPALDILGFLKPENLRVETVKIYDSVGNLVVKLKYENIIDISYLIPGVYYIKFVTDSQETDSIKIVKI